MLILKINYENVLKYYILTFIINNFKHNFIKKVNN